MSIVLDGTSGVVVSGNTNTLSGITVGKGAGSVATNTAVGASALAANSTGGNATAVGYQALNANTGGYATAVGYQAGKLFTLNASESFGSTFVGVLSGQAATTGYDNAYFGAYSGWGTTTGSFNTATGAGALKSNTTASNNTAVGYQAGYSNTGAQNTYIGRLAGYSKTSGSYNTFIGDETGYNQTTGDANTYVGSGPVYAAGTAMTTGSKNTIIGAYSGNNGGLDIRTASNYIVLSDGDGNPKAYCTSSTWLFKGNIATSSNGFASDDSQVYPTPDNTMKLGTASFRWTTVYATTGTINTSDVNTKQDIEFLDDAEKRVAVAIKSLIKKYRFKDAVAEKGDAARIHVGAVAQEVQAAFVAEGLDPARYALFCSDTWYEVNGKASEIAAEPFTAETEGAVEVTRLGLRYEELLAFVIAAL